MTKDYANIYTFIVTTKPMKIFPYEVFFYEESNKYYNGDGVSLIAVTLY